MPKHNPRLPVSLCSTLILLCAAVTLLCPTVAGATSCMAEAERDVLAPFASKRSVLEYYVRKSCEKSQSAMQEIRHPVASPEREDACREQLLVDVYLSTCVYFRDVVCPLAFEPCWDWARRHYEHCVRGDSDWFSGE